MKTNRPSLSLRLAALGAAAFVAIAVGSPALAQQGPSQDQRVPKSWNYELKNGRPVPKGNRVTNPDGSWRETIRQGSCVTVKEKTASGEYRETRECDPK